MNDLKSYIETGEKKAGRQVELAKILGISDVNIRMAKAKKRGLPADACILLADFIGVEKIEVIAASNLVTEKDEKKRKVFESCFKKTSKAASIALIVGATTIMTPSPANADIPSTKSDSLYIM